MFKYLKYYLSTILIILAILISSMDKHYPLLFFIAFSLFVILGDLFLPKDLSKNKYSYPFLINLPIYLNLPLLLLYLSELIFILGNNQPSWLLYFFNNFLNIDLIYLQQNFTLLDKLAMMANVSLFIGIIGTVPGHELTHRKKNKFDMFFGNWLLAISWDCAFAIEHVYGHHKNVGLPKDPATAKRGENIYLFIINASIKEHLDAWKIEKSHLKRRGYSPFGINNKMIIGYIRSFIISFGAFIIGGITGTITYFLCAIIAKALLEAINYIEHYGLIREPDKPVEPRHSWNANNIISSVLLYNVTRHSAHHEKSNLKFWELEPYPKSPIMPYGYLSMLYISIFLPFLFHKIMEPKLNEWDNAFATSEELKIIKTISKL